VSPPPSSGVKGGVIGADNFSLAFGAGEGLLPLLFSDEERYPFMRDLERERTVMFERDKCVMMYVINALQLGH